MKFDYHPESAIELVRIIEFYEDKTIGLGLDFLDEVEQVLEQIRKHPDSGYKKDEKVQRVLTKRFPFEIIYRVFEDKITIIAIKHTKRKPGYWEKRV